jgi:hypothetical protein
MRIEKFLFVLTLATASGLAVGAELPGRDEYAYRFPLQTGDGSEFFAVDLPLEFYQSVSDPELRDAGVYNAGGQPVPRLFEPPEAEKEGPEQHVSLGLVPLYGEESAHSDQLRFLLQRDAAGTRLELDTETTADQETGRKLAAYILDTRNLEHPLEALELDWHQASPGLIAAVRIHHSDDLRHWRSLGTGTLADIEYEGTRIEQRRIELKAKISDFLRISWMDMPAGWRLKSVSGIHGSGIAPAVRDWVTLEPSQTEEQKAEFLFDVNGFPPVDRIDLLLPDRNSVVRASVFYRPNSDSRWQRAHNGIFYTLSRQDSALHSPPATIRASRAGQWKIHIDAGTLSQPVRLRLGWRPDQLVFLAQGQQPFELVAGRAKDRLERFPQESQLGDNEIFKVLRKSGQAGKATLGSREPLSGPGQLTFGEGFSWKTLLLWLGLSAAVLLVGWMVYSLMREMKTG